MGHVETTGCGLVREDFAPQDEQCPDGGWPEEHPWASVDGWATRTAMAIAVDCEEHDVEVVTTEIRRAICAVVAQWGQNVGTVSIEGQ